MANDLTRTRWLVLIGGIIVPFCLGAIYGFSVFVPHLKAEPYNYNDTQAMSLASVSLAVGSFGMTIGGYLQDRLGPRLVSILSGVILLLGYLTAYLGGGNFWFALLGIGGLVGFAIAIGYTGPLSACSKWFPDKRGFITGISAAGFGISALVLSKVAGFWMAGGMPVHKTWLFFGILYFIGALLASIFISNPPKDWKPTGWTPPALADQTVDLTRSQMARTGRFWKLWFIFVLAAAAGMMMIVSVKAFALEILKLHFDDQKFMESFSIALIGWVAIANGSGRVIWGWLTDRFGREPVILIMFILQALAVFSLGLGWKPSTEALIILVFCVIGFNFGGAFGTFPALTAKYFGIKNFGANYGLVFSGCGVGALLGPILAGRTKDLFGQYEIAYIFGGVFMVIGVVVLLTMLRQSASIKRAVTKALAVEPNPIQP